MRLNAKWTDDCGGKKDYDGCILKISTRYWPRGGSALQFNVLRPELGLHAFDDGSKPSASGSLRLIGDRDQEEVLAEGKFEGETFEEVARQVEAWAQEQMDRAERALRAEFGDCT